MIHICTKAYNAENTLRSTMDSVLGQTVGDFVYHIRDNGSTDGTGDIIREYAARDKRIAPCSNAVNTENITDTVGFMSEWQHLLRDDDWFCMLDADDYYAPTFFEDMLRFARENDLDYAACRSDIIDSTTGKCLSEYVLSRDIIIEGDGFGSLFPDYFRFMGALWGRLQKGALFRRMDPAETVRYLASLELSHRVDTACQFWYLRYSRRAGVLAKALHNYMSHPYGHSSQKIESKVRDNHKMPDIYRDFLKAKVGYVSAENEKYIGEVFDRSMRRTLEALAREGQTK